MPEVFLFGKLPGIAYLCDMKYQQLQEQVFKVAQEQGKFSDKIGPFVEMDVTLPMEDHIELNRDLLEILNIAADPKSKHLVCFPFKAELSLVRGMRFTRIISTYAVAINLKLGEEFKIECHE